MVKGNDTVRSLKRFSMGKTVVYEEGDTGKVLTVNSDMVSIYWDKSQQKSAVYRNQLTSDAFMVETQAACGEFNVTITRNSEGSEGFAFNDDGLWVSRITGDVSTMPHLKDIQVYDIIVAVNGVTIQDKGDYEREAKGIPTFELTICRFKCDATSTTFSWAFADTNP